MDGKSILPLLQGKKSINRDALYWHFPAYLQSYEGFEAFNIKGETIAIKEFLKIVDVEANNLGMGDYSRSSILEDAPPNLFVHDLEHQKIMRSFKDLPLTKISDGVRKSLIEFQIMAKKGILEYSKASS